MAADRSPGIATDDAPDVGRPVPGIVECAPPSSYPIDDTTAAWFDAHGGTRTVLRALRRYMRDHAGKRRRAAPAAGRRSTVSR
jgi:hypothetical protein